MQNLDTERLKDGVDRRNIQTNTNGKIEKWNSESAAFGVDWEVIQASF